MVAACRRPAMAWATAAAEKLKLLIQTKAV
jgi:hypothetical protein